MPIRVLTHQNSLVSKEIYRKVFDRTEFFFLFVRPNWPKTKTEKCFNVLKVIWEHRSIQFFLHTIFVFIYRPGRREVPKSKFASVRLKTFLYDSLETREFWWVKTPMSIWWIEVHFRAIKSIFACISYLS